MQYTVLLHVIRRTDALHGRLCARTRRGSETMPNRAAGSRKKAAGKRKRKHVANPEQPHIQTTYLQRLAIIVSVIAALALGYSKRTAGAGPAAGAQVAPSESTPWINPSPEAELDEHTVHEAHTLLRTVALVMGVPLSAAWLTTHNAARTIRRWWSRFLTQHNLEDPERAPPPIKHQIDEYDLELCIYEVMCHHYYSEACAIESSAVIRQVCDGYKCSVRYLFDKMQEYEPRLVYGLHLESRMMLSKELMAERKAYAELMLPMLRAGMLRYYVWIDQKKTWIRPAKWVKTWGLSGADSPNLFGSVVDSALLTPQFKDWRTYVYVCVNAILGPFLLVKCTGTKGKNSGEPEHSAYKVGGSCVHASVGLGPVRGGAVKEGSDGGVTRHAHGLSQVALPLCHICMVQPQHSLHTVRQTQPTHHIHIHCMIPASLQLAALTVVTTHTALSEMLGPIHIHHQSHIG
jgi:hypothetical protein